MHGRSADRARPTDLKNKLMESDQPVPRQILAAPESQAPPDAPGKGKKPTIQYLRD